MLRQRIEKWLDDFRQKHNFNLAWFIRYFLGGAATLTLEFILFYILSLWSAPWRFIVGLLPEGLRASAADEGQLFAIVVSNLVSYVANYFISKYWVFRSPETRHRRDAALFALASAANLAVVMLSAKLILLGLGLLPFGGELWEALVPTLGKIGSNVVAFVTVLFFKRFIIWNDTSKY